MRKWLAVSCVSVLLGASGTVVVAPAAAHPDACAGYGSMVTSDGLGLGLVAPRTVGFAWYIVAGGCALPGTISASGTLTGGCEYATGTGVTDSGHRFSFVAVGTRIHYTGEMTGGGHMFPDWLHPGSCGAWTAQHFITSVEVVLTHQP